MITPSKSTSKSFPGYDHLWDMSGSSSRQAFLVHFDEPYKAEEHLLMHKVPLARGPFTARWFMGGKKPRDIIWVPAGPALITDRVVEALQANHLTGWSTHPVDVYGPKNELVGRYHMLITTGRSGPIDWSRSERIQVEYPARIKIELKGEYFDESTWDGSDFFWAESSGATTIVTEAVVKTLKKLKALHVMFERLDEFVRPFWPNEEEFGQWLPLPGSPQEEPPET